MYNTRRIRLFLSGAAAFLAVSAIWRVSSPPSERANGRENPGVDVGGRMRAVYHFCRRYCRFSQDILCFRDKVCYNDAICKQQENAR